MRCPKCGYENKEGVLVCNSCGALLSGQEGGARYEQQTRGEARGLDLAKAELGSVCTDPKLRGVFDGLSEDMAHSGFGRFLDYSVRQFGPDNFTRAFVSPEVAAYGDVVCVGLGSRAQVYAEFVTPYDNGITLTTTSASVPVWTLRPAEHSLAAKRGATVRDLLDLHQKRMSVLSDSGAVPLPCAPGTYGEHLTRCHLESLSYVTSGQARSRAAGQGAGCATVAAALVLLGALAFLLLAG